MKQAILIVGNFLSATLGTRGVCEDLAIKLEHSGWAVISASRKLGRVQRLLDMIGTAWNRRGAYEIAQVDVYSGPAFRWAEAVCWTLRRAGKPYVLTLHGGNLPVFAQRQPGRMRRLLGSAAAVTTPSRYLFEHMLLYRSDLSLIPNALDLNRYAFSRRTSPQPRLVWLRAFHETYNPLLAVQVVSLLAKDIPNVQLIMVGPDKGDGSMQRAQQEAERLGVADRVVFQAAVPKPEVPCWLNKGDIFLNTTNVDNTPVSVLEAMSSGLCVVSTNVGGLPYLLCDQHDALLVQKNNPVEMAAAVRRLLAEPGLAAHLSHNAHEKASLLDWAMILPQWHQLLTNVIAAHTKVV